jgi:hypothetical protein
MRHSSMQEPGDTRQLRESAGTKDHPRIGIIGGGQLAKMTALAGLKDRRFNPYRA